MAQLSSPGVQVSVIDESFYTPAAPGTIPLVFVASKQDKENPSGSIAQGTTAANAGKVWLITSQRDLTDTFGTPLFYTDSSGNPLHGNELNEYGLQAAYSALGVSSRVYVVRSDLDLSALVPSSSIPVGNPVAGTYWVDTANSTFGVKEWNSSTQAFSVKTPIVLDDSTPGNNFTGVAPNSSVGQQGDYAMVVGFTTGIALYYKTSSNTWVKVTNGFDGGKAFKVSPHYDYPTYNASTSSGSVWVTTTVPSNGANWNIKFYDSTSEEWTTVTTPIYGSIPEATRAFDTTGGGKNIPVGTLFIESNSTKAVAPAADFRVWRKQLAGTTTIQSPSTNLLATPSTTCTFTIRETRLDGSWGPTKTITLFTTSTTEQLAALIPAALSAQGMTYTTASYDSTTNILTMSHTAGGSFQMSEVIGTSLSIFFSLSSTANLYAPAAGDGFTYMASSWKPLVFEAKSTTPSTAPADGTLWYDSKLEEVDVLYHNGTTWVGYRDGSAFPNTNATGPLVSATQPTTQSNGGALVNGDIWIDTSDPDMYGRNIYVYDGSKWVLQDVTDQTTPNGWLFADVRWNITGNVSTPASIRDLLVNNYLDPDAPDPALYPRGMRLWNTRRSGFNVKKYVVGYINTSANGGLNQRFPYGAGQSMAGYFTSRWVSQNPVAEDGGPAFGRAAQRKQVVMAFKELIDTNAAVRDTDTLGFNLIATPGYPEAIANMVALNVDRGITALVVGDTPFRLLPTGTVLSEYGMNTNNSLDNDDNGAVTYDEYLAMYYPSGFTNDNTGNNIVVPPSHMMLRTIINSDAKSYPWFAPAGTRRGGVDNATKVGYISSEGEFTPVALHQGLRDVLQDPKVAINPIATLTGVGIVAYGQRTRARNASSLDRINVARLVCYLRRQLDILARPFLFEPNDSQTRREIKAAAESLLLELVGQRALYDFIVVCDETNNTPSRIDRNELYMDIAVEPVKAVEFIYIPLRLKKTGSIQAGI